MSLVENKFLLITATFMQKLNDPDFGTICFSGCKSDNFELLERRANFNGHDLAIEIEPEDPEVFAISEVQRQAVKIALNLPSDTLLLSAPAVIQNYECYDEGVDGTELPELANPIDIWNLITPDYISVPAHSFPPYYDVKIPTFILYAECIWDIEHGLEIRFRNGYADASDQQGQLGVELD